MHAFIKGREHEIFSFTYDEELDAVGTFTLEIPLVEVGNNFQDLYLEEIEIFYKDFSVTKGFVSERPTINISDTEEIRVSLTCENVLNLLSQIRAKSNAHYQDDNIAAILGDLLTFASNWVVEYVNYTLSGSDKITIDLRNKETLFSQITEVIKNVPGLHFRYGGVNNLGQYILQIGTFNDFYRLLDHNFELNLEPKATTIYRLVEAYGGFSAEKRVDLSYALLDPRTALHPDYAQYPINFFGGFYYVENTALTKGFQITKDFDLQKTENNVKPTNAELIEAGYSLYQKTVAFMKQHDNTTSYTTSALIHYKDLPRVGDRVFVNKKLTDRFTDLYRDVMIELFEVKANLKIYHVSFSFDETFGDEIKVMFSLTNGEYGENFDSEVELYERLDTFDERATLDALQISPAVFSSDSHTGADASDCTGTDIVNGKIFTFNMTNIPSWATNVSFAIASRSPSTAIYEVNTVPSLPATDLELCVAPANGDWNTLGALDTITFTVIYYYS